MARDTLATGATPPPLAGLKVLDLSRILAGPVCCQLLADLGADVVKVERPGRGDDTRSWGPPFVADGGPSAYFVSCNRSKRSLALDLEPPAGRAVLADLVRRVDVLVENFLPPTLARLGLDSDNLARLNPRLVSAAISGFGRTGPWADRPGYDLAIQAWTGLMSLTGPVEGPPSKVGVALTDVITGLYAAASVLAGLWARDRGGATAGGRAFDLALADCTLASLVNVAAGALVSGERPARFGNAHPQIVPYEVFATRDGHLALAIGNDDQFARFAAAVERPGWTADSRFSSNPARVIHRAELVPLVAAELAGRTTAQWQALLESIDVPHAPVLAVDQALELPQVVARGLVREVVDGSGRRYRVVGSPVHWQGNPAPPSIAPPELGEHTDQVLADWLGYDATRIADLREAGVVA